MKIKYHKCLLCPCQINISEIYCSSCSWEVFAARENAKNDKESLKHWNELWAKIQRLDKQTENLV